MSERADLPTGTVTLVLTDIEGSTRLLIALGDAYGDALAVHRRIVRRAFGAHDGAEVDTQGDAFLYAFGDAADALQGAAEAQRALEAHPWPDGHTLRVRMGVHTGRPTRTEEGYVGLDLHQAARIMGAAHGEQVIVSSATAEHAGDAALGGLQLRDLGEHRLKDLTEPVRIYQLCGDELRGDFPPPQTLEGHFTNLPAQSSRLVGREREVAELRRLLDEGRRLVTLTGPGGTGKTRLALQVAAEALESFPGGVFFCDLSHVVDPALVPGTIAGTLGLREAGARSVEETLTAYLAERRLLLVLDNMEQLLEASPLIGRLLGSCPHLAVVATSRAPLRLDLEAEWGVAPLASSDASALLAERAELVGQGAAFSDPEDQLVGEEICARLDGLPLAIELAAARLRVMSPQELLHRLERRLPILTQGARDAPARQRTLRATIAWSHDLLGPGEQAAFARCGVFGGSFTLQAAEAICDAEIDQLEALVEHSLVRREGDRLGMLETVREYAVELLTASGEGDELRRRHADHVVRQIDELRLGFYGSDQADALEEADAELDNVRAALAWMLEQGDREQALALATSLWVLWETRHRSEGRRWLLRALDAIGEASAERRAAALLAAGNLVYFQGDTQAARPLLERSADLFEALDDPAGRARALGRLCWVAADDGDPEEEKRLLDVVLALLPRVGDPAARGDVLRFVGGALTNQGDLPGALESFEECRALWEALGCSQQVANCLNNLGWTAVMTADHGRARGLLVESLEIARQTGDRFTTSLALGSLGVVCALQGDLAAAGHCAAENLELCRDSGDKRLGSESLVVAAAVLGRTHPAEAVTLIAAAEALRPLEDVQPTLIATHVAPYTDGLDQDRLGKQQAAGRRLSLGDAVRQALVLLEA